MIMPVFVNKNLAQKIAFHLNKKFNGLAQYRDAKRVHASVFFDLYACVHNDFETLAYQ
jgi:hypothetical protein